MAFLSSIIGGNFVGAQGFQGVQGLQGLSNQGTQGVVGPPSSWNLIAKTIDESRNNNTTTSPDGALSFSMTSGLTYLIRAKIFATTTSAADFKYRFSGPSTSSVQKYVRVTNANGTGSNPFLAIGFTSSLDSVDIPLLDNANGTLLIELDAVVIPSANGSFQFQWAQNTSNAGPTTVFDGSYLEYAVV